MRERVPAISIKDIWIFGRIFIFLVILNFTLITGVSGETFTVCSSGCNFSSIQLAVDAASSGDTILVDSGIFLENININKSLNLFGGGSDNTRINAKDQDAHVINISADNVNVSGFTLTSALNNWPDSGIYLSNVRHCNIFNNNVSDNYYGILLHLSDNNTIKNNTVGKSLKGIALSFSNYNTIRTNTVTIKNGTSLGALFFYNSSRNSIFNNFFNNSKNFGFGGKNYNNSWNESRQEAINIIGGKYIAGNFWASPDGKGFSEVCNDSDYDDLCDFSYNLVLDNTDFLPLARVPYYCDNDGDDYFNSQIDGRCVGQLCPPAGCQIEVGTDCNDNDLDIFPGAPEKCDEKDNQCPGEPGHGTIDEGLKTTFYYDRDGDTYGNQSDQIIACSQPINYVLDSTDCDDSSNLINPGKAEITCNGKNDDCNALTLDKPDSDKDGVTICSDCDDGDKGRYPGNSETTCNSIDDDCDPLTLDNPDKDGDGVDVCSDCDDNDVSTYPGATDICDEKDNQCPGDNGYGQTDEICLFVDDDGVCGGKSDCSLSIQEAVNMAGNGFIIKVFPGVYVENVYVSKPVNIVGEGAQKTIVSPASSRGNAFHVQTDGANISGFTITGADSTNYAGISLRNSNYVGIYNNTISSNSIGIFSIRSYGNKIINNKAEKSREGFYLFNSGNNILESNRITDTVLGVNNYYSDNNTMKRNIINSNNNGIFFTFSKNNAFSSNKLFSSLQNGMRLYFSSNNLFYNNYFNNSKNVYSHTSANLWNVERQNGQNIVWGNHIGGNLWAVPNNTGFSGKCNDKDIDGLCDSSFTFENIDGENNTDHLPIRALSHTIYVDESGDCEGHTPCYEKIQTAIDGAVEGASILVSTGNYPGNIILNKSLNLIGVQQGGVIIDSSGIGSHVFRVTADSVKINGFVITGSPNGYSGIKLDGVDSCSVINNSIHNNTHGIYLVTSGNSLISSNNITNSSNGLYFVDSDYNAVKNNRISNNRNYGILLREYSSSNIIIDNYFRNGNNTFFDSELVINQWNVSKSNGTNIINGSYLGGNFWGRPGENGFSNRCSDNDKDGICDFLYSLSPGNVDYLPLAHPTACNMTFKDVPESHYAYDYIRYLYCNDIISGYKDGTFRPSSPATRAVFTLMVVKGKNIHEVLPANPTFQDVSTSHWAYGFIEAAFKEKYVSGYNSTYFKPDANISRAEMATIVAKAGNWTYNGGLEDFSDVPKTHWAYNSIMALKEQGIVTGYPDGTFRPTNQSTRAVASIMVTKMIQAD